MSAGFAARSIPPGVGVDVLPVPVVVEGVVVTGLLVEDTGVLVEGLLVEAVVLFPVGLDTVWAGAVDTETLTEVCNAAVVEGALLVEVIECVLAHPADKANIITNETRSMEPVFNVFLL
jgi:hypothetical protein